MKSLLFKLLMAASLLAHTVLGCCWHHAHAEECRDAAAADACPGHGACHGKAGHRSDKESTIDSSGALCGLCDAPDEHGAGCDEPDCAYIKSRTASAPAMSAAAVTWATWMVPAPPCGRTESADLAPPAGCAGAALRAALQVWLI